MAPDGQGRARSAAGEGQVELAKVEGGGGEVQFAAGGGQTAAGEPIQDLLQVADAGFDGCAATLVELGTRLSAQPVAHGFSGCGAGRYRPDGRGGVGGSGLVAGLAQRDQPVGSGC